jgi:hypothetical protein
MRTGSYGRRLVCRGRHVFQGRRETLEALAWCLITQRSQVQILPPLPGKTASEFSSGAVFMPDVTRIVTTGSDRDPDPAACSASTARSPPVRL